MEAYTTSDIPHAFIATSNDVLKLSNILKDKGFTVLATVACTDGIVRKFDNCESLAQYENPPRAAIRSIRIYAQSGDISTTAEISLGTQYAAPISISLRGEENLVSSMRTELTDIADGMRSWYSKISTIDFFNIWFPIFAALFMLASIMSSSSTSHPATLINKALLILAAIVACIGSIVAIIWAISQLRKRFFPVATFAIGQGLHRHQHNEQIRWVVIVGFLVGVIASIVATALLT